MVVQKNHLWILAFVLVVSVAYFAQRSENTKRADRDRAAVAESCVRSVTRDAYEASGFAVLAERVGRRDNPGDQRSAARYEAVARSVSSSFPRPKGLHDPMRMIQVEVIEAPNGDLRFELTDDAKKLIEAGCRQAFE